MEFHGTHTRKRLQDLRMFSTCGKLGGCLRPGAVRAEDRDQEVKLQSISTAINVILPVNSNGQAAATPDAKSYQKLSDLFSKPSSPIAPLKPPIAPRTENPSIAPLTPSRNDRARAPRTESPDAPVSQVVKHSSLTTTESYSPPEHQPEICTNQNSSARPKSRKELKENPSVSRSLSDISQGSSRSITCPLSSRSQSHRVITIPPHPKKGILKSGYSMVVIPPNPEFQLVSRRAKPTDRTSSADPNPEDPNEVNQTPVTSQPPHTTSSITVSSSSPVTPSDSRHLIINTGLVTVPKCRGPPLNPPSPTRVSAWPVPPQIQTCSHCQNMHYMGNPTRLLKSEQIKQATNNYCPKYLLESGEFEFIYRGSLDGLQVAIKTVRQDNSDAKFSAETDNLTGLRHPNVVPLLGYCLEEGKRALVYGYACNRSLHWHLSSAVSGTNWIKWPCRRNMAIYLALGLHHLHFDSERGPIIHGDFRSKNIFLNHDMVPKIGGFAQSRRQREPIQTSTLKGHPGYVAPEYSDGGHISEKVDIYSFGVVLLELVTGRIALDPSRPLEQQCLVDWARPMLESTTAECEIFKKGILDPKLMAMGDDQEFNELEFVSIIHAARLCIRKDPNMRPGISQVLDILTNTTTNENLAINSSRNRAPNSSPTAATDSFPVLTTNRTCHTGALTTLRAVDPACLPLPKANADHGSEEKENKANGKAPMDSPDYKSPPRTPIFKIPTRRELILNAGTNPSAKSPSSGQTRLDKERVMPIQLPYRPLHYRPVNNHTKPVRRVHFHPPKLSYKGMTGF